MSCVDYEAEVVPCSVGPEWRIERSTVVDKRSRLAILAAQESRDSSHSVSPVPFLTQMSCL